MQPTSNYHSVMQVVDKQQLQDLLEASMRDQAAPQDQDSRHSPGAGPAQGSWSMKPQGHFTEAELQAALEDDLTELTASNWVQGGASPHTSSHHVSRGHNSGGFELAAARLHPHSAAISSASTDAGSSTSSKHLGFFQVVSGKDPAPTATPAPPADAGRASMPARPKTPPGSARQQPQQQQLQQGELQQAEPLHRPLSAPSAQDQQQQQWLQFQQHAPGAAVTNILRRASSPEHVLQAALQETQLRQEPAAVRKALARLSLDGGHQRLLGGLHGQPGQQSRNPGWQLAGAPAGPDEGSSCSPHAMADASRTDWHQLQQEQLHGPVHAERPASTPPFLQGAGQRYAASGWAGAATAVLQQQGPRDAQNSWSRPQSPGPALSAPLSGHPPLLLSPEAAAAAEEAAASIQLAMAAVDSEIEQLKLLQALNKQRRKLQAQARVAVARAAAAAAASVAASVGPGPAAVFAASRGGSSVAAQGRVDSLGAGSFAGNSGSTHTNSSAFSSSGSLLPEAASLSDTAWGAAAMPPGGLMGEQQHLAATNSQGMSPHYQHHQQQQQRRADPGGFSGSSGLARDGGWVDDSSAMPVQLQGSLSPRGSTVSPAGFGNSRPGRGHARSATWSDLPTGPQLQQLGPQVTQQGWGSAHAWDGQGGVGAGGSAGAGGPAQGWLQAPAAGDVQDEWQQLAGDASQLVQLRQVLQMLQQG